MKCFSCKNEVSVEDKVGFRDECHHCEADLHVCLNCKFYDVTAYNECHESSADRVVDKERANFCEYFVVADGSDVKGVQDSASDTKKKLEELFKK